MESVFRPLLAPTAASSPSPFQRRRRLLSRRDSHLQVEVKKKPSPIPNALRNGLDPKLHRTQSDAALKGGSSSNVKRKLGISASPPPAPNAPRDDAAVPARDRVGEDGGGPDLAVRLIVVGGRQVGKSALTVRYLTRRYIGEYQSFSGEHTNRRQNLAVKRGITQPRS